MKKIRWEKYIALFLVLTLALLPGVGTVRAQAASVKTLKKITAEYDGDAVAIGKEIDMSELYVTAHYEIDNGYFSIEKTERVTEGLVVVPRVISKEGTNTLHVIYEGQVDQITVQGKKLLSIYASYEGDDVYIGETVSRNDITVRAFYSDGSYEEIDDYTLDSDVVTEEGINVFPIIYEEEHDFIYVYGIEPRKITSLIATYHGDDLVVGNYIDKSDITVFALYNDGDMEIVKEFNISPATVTKEGKNTIEVTYGKAKDTITVHGVKKEIVSITAHYIGGGAIVGSKIKAEDVEVLATYNDGSVGQLSEFTLSETEILYEGPNIIFVYCGRFLGVIQVDGVKGFVPNYKNSMTGVVFSPDYRKVSIVTLGMAEGVKKGSFEITPLDDVVAKRVVQRVIPTEEYIPFLLTYDDDEMITKFPMAMKVTLPEGYAPEKFGVYYTPNQKTIMAKVDGEFLDEEKTVYQFIVYEPGAYILVHEVSNLLVREIVVKEEVTLHVNRNYSVNPVVLPKTAENKKVTYWSSDDSVATVTETGKVRTHAEGVCEIWVEAEDDSGVYAVVTITVESPRKK